MITSSRHNGLDIDNLVKFVLDSLNGIAYCDDSQICAIRSMKLYANAGEEARTEVEIRRIVERTPSHLIS